MSTQAKSYLVQVHMDQSDTIDMRYYGVYQCQWYIRHYEDFNQYSTIECRFWSDIGEMKQDGTLGKMFSVSPLRVKGFLQR